MASGSCGEKRKEIPSSAKTSESDAQRKQKELKMDAKQENLISSKESFDKFKGHPFAVLKYRNSYEESRGVGVRMNKVEEIFIEPKIPIQYGVVDLCFFREELWVDKHYRNPPADIAKFIRDKQEEIEVKGQPGPAVAEAEPMLKVIYIPEPLPVQEPAVIIPAPFQKADDEESNDLIVD